MLLRHKNHLRIIALLVFGTFTIILTTQPTQLPLIYYTKALTGGTAFGAAVGHAGLFAVLTAVTYFTFALRLPLKAAIAWSMGIVLLCGTMTELFQLTVPSRGYDLADLLANWLGVFMIGFVVVYTANRPLTIIGIKTDE